MSKIYGNLILALERTGTTRKELGDFIGLSQPTLKNRFDSEDEWTLKEMNKTRDLLKSRGCIENIADLFERK